ncbi:MAG: hypothetical protein KAJ90_02415 [Desulfobacterales bacterium]|nr:hypothetical protein [Desulfobacterales bacterium]
MKKAAVVLLILGLIGIPFSACAVELGVRGWYWFPDLDGHVRADAGGITGTMLDLKDDLGMTEEDYPIIEAFVGIGRHHISLSGMRADYSGDKNVSEIVFNGETFKGDIKSTLKYDMIDLAYQYDVVDFENTLAGFSIGIIGKIKYIDGNVELRSDAQSLSEKESFQAPVPMIGLGLHVGLIADILEATIKATGIGYSDATIYDAMADVSFTPFLFLDIHGGYRIIDFDVEVDDVELKHTMSGPYVAVTVGF